MLKIHQLTGIPASCLKDKIIRYWIYWTWKTLCKYTFLCMAPGACVEPSSTGITGVSATIINYHPVSPRKSRHCCLGESPTQARLKCLDLRCSFEALVKAEYGGHDHLDFAARNYIENMRKKKPESAELLMRGPCRIWWWPCTGTMWTCSDAIPLRPATDLYLRTTAWKWPPN